MATVTYQCPNCGGGLQFDPRTQKFACEYCRSQFEERELKKPDPAAAGSAEAAAYTCPSCGAQIVTEETTAATFCYFCHNPVVLSERLSDQWKPDKVIPFSLEKKEVEKQFQAWCKKKHFMKRDFFSQSQLERLTGVYYPFWFIDSQLQGKMRALGDRIHTWRAGNTEYIETETFELIREADLEFDDYSFAALEKPEVDLSKGVQPFDCKKAKDFSMAYLSGFQAEKRLVDRSQISPQVHKTLHEYTEELLKSDAGGFVNLRVTDFDLAVKREDWKYTLLPVWVLTYQYRNKTFYYAMNGQTGKVCGRVPLSLPRLFLLFGAVSIALFLLFLLGGLLL